MFTTCELTNGIRVITMPDVSSRTSAVSVLRGSADDPDWLEGAAHLAEHMVCRASNSYTDRQATLLMEKLFGGTDGIGIKIYTMWTETVYGHDLLYNHAMLREAFLLMASLVTDAVHECHNMRGRLFDLNGLLVERGAVHNETQWNRDDASRYTSDLLQGLIYTTNPLRRPGCADIRQLRKVDKVGRLKQWMAPQYVPENMAVFLFGLKQDVALQWIAETGLDGLKSDYHTDPPAHSQGDAFPQLGNVREFFVDQPGLKQTHVGFGWPTDTFLDADRCAMDVLARMVKMRTEWMLREENTDINAGVYHPAASWFSTRLHGMLEIWFATVGDQNYRESAESRVLTMVRDIKDDTSTAFAEEVEHIKYNLVMDAFTERRDMPGALLERAVHHLANGDVGLQLLELRPAELAAVTPKMVREAARKYLRTDAFAHAVIRPLYIPQDEYDRAPEELREKYLKHLLKPAE